MPLPTPNRNLPDTDDTGPPGPTGAAYADKVAAEVERIWQLVPNPLINVGGSANAITAQCSPPLIADVTHGQPFWLVPEANNTGGVTIDIDSRGAADVVAYDGTALQADDLVLGEGVELRGYISGSPATTVLRLPHPTARQLLELASAGGASIWEQIGDSGALGTVANVEFTFTADRYSRVVLVFSDLLQSNVATGQARSVVVTLRNAGGAIVTLTSGTAQNAVSPADIVFTGEGVFTIGIINATKRHIGTGFAFGDSNSTDTTAVIAVASGSNATAPDRVRVNWNTGNINGGRVMAYGLLATAP